MPKGAPPSDLGSECVQSSYGDPYYDWYSYKENAELLVKLRVTAATAGVDRYHWVFLETAD